MTERKVQLVGSATYSVSLPKEWVKKSGLSKNDSVFFTETADRNLLISPKNSPKEVQKTFSLNVEDFGQNLFQVLYALYYLGFEEIKVFSGSFIPTETRSRIKEVVSFMSGTEIEFESPKSIVFRVLLDKSKINVNNVFYRIGVLLQSSLDNMLGKIDSNEINRNEIEIDRLFHLSSKIIIIASDDRKILESSGIKHHYFVVPYLLIGKKLENIADEIEGLSKIIPKTRERQKELNEILLKIKATIAKDLVFFEKSTSLEPKVPSKEEKEATESEIRLIENADVRSKLYTIYRFIYDIEEELVNISFYMKMISENMI